MIPFAGNYLVSLPRFTRFLYVKISEGLPKKPKAARRFWNAFAQCLIEKKGKSSVAILSGDHVMCFRVDSFLDFMHNFDSYFQ